MLAHKTNVPSMKDTRSAGLEMLKGRWPCGPLEFGHFLVRVPSARRAQKTAQGFSPGNDTHKEIALKGRPNGIDYNVYICCCMQWLSHHRKFSYQEELRELLK